MEFKVTPDPIVIRCKHWRIQVLKGRKDQDMRKGIAKKSKGQKGDPGVRDVMKMIDAFTTYLENFNRRFEGHNIRT